MKAEEKKILYTLLKTASDGLCGYSDPSFPDTIPVFSDDTLPEKDKFLAEPGLTPLPDNFSADNKKMSAQRPNAAEALSEIVERIGQCKRCQLCKTRQHVVPGEGVPQPAVLLVGEGPGADEDASGIPFVGPAGKLLDKMMAAISLDRHVNCFIANIVKCRPPHNRDPQPDEAAACRSFLEAQIQILHPAMILALGRVAAQNLLQTDIGIGKLRGTFHNYNGIPVLATYHPSALLRNVDLKRPTWEDLKLFRTRLLTIVPDYAKNFYAIKQGQ